MLRLSSLAALWVLSVTADPLSNSSSILGSSDLPSSTHNIRGSSSSVSITSAPETTTLSQQSTINEDQFSVFSSKDVEFSPDTVGRRLIVQWSDSSSSGKRRLQLVDEFVTKETAELNLSDEQAASLRSSFSRLLPSYRDDLYGDSRDFEGENRLNSYTISKFIKNYFNGVIAESTSAKSIEELFPYAMLIRGVHRLNPIGVDIIFAESDQEAIHLLKYLKKSSDVLNVEIDQVFQLSPEVLKSSKIVNFLGDEAKTNDLKASRSVPNDSYFSRLWGIDQVSDVDINGPEAYSYMSSVAKSNVTVAMIDTGILATHPDLVNQLWINSKEIPDDGIDNDQNGYIDDFNGWNFVSNSKSWNDDNGHGSHTAGTVGATGNNSIGISGVAYQVANLMALKTMDSNGKGTYSAAISALSYASSMGADLSSNSWGGSAGSSSLQSALQNAPIIHLCAAGNDGSGSVRNYPAYYTVLLNNVVSVAAIDSSGSLASYSNYGNAAVDFAAPGTGIISACLSNNYCNMSGTSMATPHVAGVAALMIARGKALVSSAKLSPSVYGPFPSDVKSALISSLKSSSSLNGKVIYPGVVDAASAIVAIESIILQRIKNSPSSTTTTTTTTTTTMPSTSTTTTTTTTTTTPSSTCTDWTSCSVKCGIGKQTRICGQETQSRYCFSFQCFNFFGDKAALQDALQHNLNMFDNTTDHHVVPGLTLGRGLNAVCDASKLQNSFYKQTDVDQDETAIYNQQDSLIDPELLGQCADACSLKANQCDCYDFTYNGLYKAPTCKLFSFSTLQPMRESAGENITQQENILADLSNNDLNILVVEKSLIQI